MAACAGGEAGEGKAAAAANPAAAVGCCWVGGLGGVGERPTTSGSGRAKGRKRGCEAERGRGAAGRVPADAEGAAGERTGARAAGAAGAWAASYAGAIREERERGGEEEEGEKGQMLCHVDPLQGGAGKWGGGSIVILQHC